MFFPGGFNHPGNNIDNNRLYNVLGVNKDADPNTIRKAYRKLALRYHPDKCKEKGAEEKFKEISEAYAVLSDKDKKKMYDQFGEDYIKRGGDGGGAGGAGGMFNPFDIFRREEERRRERKPKPIGTDLHVSLKQIYTEDTVEVVYDRVLVCKSCKGIGCKSKSDISSCAPCGGRGMIMQMRQLGPGMMQQIQRECPHCEGEGKIIKKENICKACKGRKICKESAKYMLPLKQDMKDDDRIPIEGIGCTVPDVDKQGDLVIILHVEEEDGWKRVGSNLEKEVEILLSEALCGLSRVIEHLDGKKILIKSDDIIKPMERKIVYGKGLSGGDLIIIFKVIFPEFLTDDEKMQCAIILPRSDNREDQTGAEEVVMSKFRGDDGKGGRAEDESDDEGLPNFMGGDQVPGVQCAQQ